MKNSKILSFMLMAMVLVLPTCISCSSDDDGGGSSNYTSEEITELLMGKWVIGGNIECKTTTINFNGQYKGTLEFKDKNRFSFSITEGDKYEYQTELNGEVVNKSTYLERSVVPSSGYYSILKRGGDTYLIMDNSNFPFKIVSLKKNSLKLVLDEDFVDNNNENGHVYMTIISN